MRAQPALVLAAPDDGITARAGRPVRVDTAWSGEDRAMLCGAMEEMGQRRGRNYTAVRHAVESALRVVLVGDWPARLWSLVPGALDVRDVRSRLTVAGPAAPACRLALVTDLHLGPTTPWELVDRAFDLVAAATPDVLLLGGDYAGFHQRAADLRRLSTRLGSLTIPTRLAVIGNHDLWTGEGPVVAALEDADVKVLVNDVVRCPSPWSHVAVVGLDDPWAGDCDADRAFAAADGAAVRVVLCHSPDGLLHAASHRFDLYLCGHTHGGHLATPWGPIVVPSGKLSREFAAGFARFNSAQVYVSRGLGGTEVPFRLFAPPDVLILDLEFAADAPDPHDTASS